MEILAQKILKDKNYLRRLEKYFFRTHKNFKKMADLIFKRGKDFFRKWSNEQLASLFKKFNLESGKAIAGSYIPY